MQRGADWLTACGATKKGGQGESPAQGGAGEKAGCHGMNGRAAGEKRGRQQRESQLYPVAIKTGVMGGGVRWQL